MTYDDYFGGCPSCGASYGIVNVGRGHWGYCSEHRAKWHIGSSLFSSWRMQTEDEQRAIYNKIGLGDFNTVEPLHMLDGRNPIAGDRGSYVSPDEWFAEVVARQGRPARQKPMAPFPHWARQDKSYAPFKEAINRVRQFHGVEEGASWCDAGGIWLQHEATHDGRQVSRDSRGEFQTVIYENRPDGEGWTQVSSFNNHLNEPHALWVRIRRYGDGL